MKPVPGSGAALKRAFFGPLILLSTTLLGLALARADSLEYAIGYAAGKLLVSVAVSASIFLIFRCAIEAMAEQRKC